MVLILLLTFCSRLTSEHFVNMKISFSVPSGPEKKTFNRYFFEYKSRVTFDEFEMGLLDVSIKPPIVVHTVSHTSW